MVAVQTIAGPVDSADLGRTLAHEHLCSGMVGMERVGLFDLDLATRQDLEALANVAEAGIRTIIDCTPLDNGRQPSLFERLAGQSPVHIIAATGVYGFIPLPFLAWSVDTIGRYFLRDIQNGIEGTAIRAGVIKLAWGAEYQLAEGGDASPRGRMEKCARGAARAARIAGVPIICHHLAADRTGERLLDLFEEEGVDLRAVTIGHSDSASDSAYLIGLAKRGATVGLDRFNSIRFGKEELERRSQLALDMINAGYRDQMTLSHDRAAYSLTHGTPEGGPRPFDPRCWVDVPTVQLPYLAKNGASEDDIEATMAGSVRAMFEAASAMRTG